MVRRIAPALVLAAALATAAPAAAAAPDPPAPAQPPYSEGGLEYGVGQACYSFIFPPPVFQNQVGAGAAFQGSEQRIAAAGQVFYVRLLTAAIGDICGGGTTVLPEFVLPNGVFAAVSQATPVMWRYAEDGQAVTKGGVVVGQGSNGGTTIVPQDPTPNDGQPELWPLANTGAPLEIYLPVVSSRRLKGIGSQAPTCPNREEGNGPCPRDQSGDHVQIVVQTSCPCTPSTLIPYVGLFAGPPRAPKVKLRGRRLTITTAPLATVRIRAKRKTLRRRAPVSGVVRVKLPRGTRGRISVVATTTDGAVSKATRKRL